MQPSLKTNFFECKYYAEVSFKHAGLTFGKKIPTVTVPITVYYGRETVLPPPPKLAPEDIQEMNEKQAHLPPNPYLAHHPDLANVQPTNHTSLVHGQPVQDF